MILLAQGHAAGLVAVPFITHRGIPSGGAWHGVQVHDDEAYTSVSGVVGQSGQALPTDGAGHSGRVNNAATRRRGWRGRAGRNACAWRTCRSRFRGWRRACRGELAVCSAGTCLCAGRTSTRAAWVHGLKQQASVAIPRAGGMQTCDHIGTSFLASSKWQINLQSVLLIMTLHSMHARSGSRVEPSPFARLASRPADNHGSNLAGRQ
jgi:hypothetical protein